MRSVVLPEGISRALTSNYIPQYLGYNYLFLHLISASGTTFICVLHNIIIHQITLQHTSHITCAYVNSLQKFVPLIIQSHWNIKASSAALLPSRLSTFEAIPQIQLQSSFEVSPQLTIFNGLWCEFLTDRSLWRGWERAPIRFYHGPLARYVWLRVAHARECRERFPRHRRIVIPTYITARAWRTCRDTYRDR